MALEDTATAGAADQPIESAPVVGDTASAEPPPEQNAAQDQADEGAEPPSDEAKLLAELPPALRTRYNQVFTQKSQKLAEERKRFEQYQGLISSLESDPIQTIKALAQRANLIQEPPPGKQQVDEVLSELAQIVGEDEAKRLAPAFEKLAEKVIDTKIQPLRQHQEYVTAQIAQEQTQAVMKAFSEKHPGWEKHEPKMLEIAQHLQPNGMDEGAYLDTLFKLATYDTQSAAQTKALAEKMAKSVAASENVASGVNASRVTPGPRQFKDVDEALAAAAADARKGVVWG